MNTRPEDVTTIVVRLYDPTYIRDNSIPGLEHSENYHKLIDYYSRSLKWEINTPYVEVDFKIITSSSRYESNMYKILSNLCPIILLLMTVEVNKYMINNETGRDTWDYIETSCLFQFEIVKLYINHYNRKYLSSLVYLLLFIGLFLY